MKKRHNLNKINKQTDNKFLNMYCLEYDDKVNYYLVSRREANELAVAVVEDKTDGVRILPYYFENGRIKVVVIKEFRYPVNRYVYQLPAGLVDAGEDEYSTAIRELKEEIGATAKKLVLKDKAGYVSAGMSDEKVSHFWAEIQLDEVQQLVGGEDISIEIIDFEDILTFVDSNEFALVSKVQLKEFYYEVLYKNFNI